MRAPVCIQLVRKDAKVPEYASPGAACFDLRAHVDSRFIWIDPGERVKIPTGIAVQMLPGYEMQIRPRSGLSFHRGIDVIFGTVDSDYRGEVSVILVNNSSQPFQLANHERIAQAIVVEAPRVQWLVTDKLDETSRGKGGFGSTGEK